MKITTLGLAFGALVAGLAPAGAETLADAMAKAYANNPSLAAERAGLRALNEDEVQERAAGRGAASAVATYGYRNTDSGTTFTPRSRNDTDPFSLGVSGSLNLYDGGRTVNGTRSAQAAVSSGESSLTSSEQDVLLAAVTAYEDVRRDIALVGVSRSNVRVISEQLRAAQDRFDVGEVTRTDVSQAEARLAAARSTLAAQTGALARSRQAYLAAVGELPEDLSPPPPLPQLPATEAEAIALAEAAHPLLVAARYDVRQAEYEVKRALGGMLPTVDLEGDLAYSDGAVLIDGGTTDSNSASIGVRASVPLWSGGRNPSLVREAQARLAQRQALIHAIARQVRQQVSNSWSGLEVSRISITAARQQIRAAQIAFDGVKEEATLGARTTLDVLDADQELQLARADLYRSMRDEYVAGYTLLSSVGSLTVDHLGLDVARYDPKAYPAKVETVPNGWFQDESAKWEKGYRP
ncbi:MAG: TolC family outer membrane protein [Pseudomonadota bacterium]|nr:TolC family outer membrane protein [Pseudomonadota bacterium]MEE3098574.1 TolC family outer membrane protein [Pseudomonadota bacterium]